jgi:DNA-binding NarL/FixJ family response regulator
MNSIRSPHKKAVYKVLIIDDHPIVRQGLAQLINQETDFSVCGDAGDIPQALNIIENSHPDIIIIDLSLGFTSGIRLIEDLSQNIPGLPILTFSMHDELIYAERCLKAGARGYLMKQESPEMVITALRKILNGNIHISSKVGSRLLHKFVSRNTATSDSPVDLLSNRELEVFRLVGQGLKTKKIARELSLSTKTIETYIDHIKKKLNFDDTRSMFMHAVQWNMSDTLD